jgi:hypothetical protein
MSSMVSKLAALPLEIESWSPAGAKDVSSDFQRITTVVRLRGAGEEGIGEDDVYDAPDQTSFQKAGAVPNLSGSWTLVEFGGHVDQLDFFPSEPDIEPRQGRS